MQIELTPEGSIVIDGVKVGEWDWGEDGITDMRLKGDTGLISSYTPHTHLHDLINSGFQPQKWEE